MGQNILKSTFDHDSLYVFLLLFLLSVYRRLGVERMNGILSPGGKAVFFFSVPSSC